MTEDSKGGEDGIGEKGQRADDGRRTSEAKKVRR